jgi:hypothetical protein
VNKIVFGKLYGDQFCHLLNGEVCEPGIWMFAPLLIPWTIEILGEVFVGVMSVT